MIKVQSEDFDVGNLHADLQKRASNPGAITTFTGLVREFCQDLEQDQAATGDRVLCLELEHYPGMTEKALQSIADQACERWAVQAFTIIHRVGSLHSGDRIVYVGVASAHRGDAFAAAEFIMDYLKTSAPFWKKQHHAQGADWVSARESDLDAAARWQR